MAKKIVWDWEEIDECAKRVKVIGGWILHHKTQKTESMVFINDTDWQWQPIAPYVDAKIEKANLAKDFKA